MRSFFYTMAALCIASCSHPLEIVGEGDIVSSNSKHDCALEDQPCSNTVIGAYDVTYAGLRRKGWQFERWEGCGDQHPACTFNVPEVTVSAYWGQVMPPLRAVFTPTDIVQVTQYPGSVDIDASDLTGGTDSTNSVSYSLRIIERESGHILHETTSSSSPYFSWETVAGSYTAEVQLEDDKGQLFTESTDFEVEDTASAQCSLGCTTTTCVPKTIDGADYVWCKLAPTNPCSSVPVSKIVACAQDIQPTINSQSLVRLAARGGRGGTCNTPYPGAYGGVAALKTTFAALGENIHYYIGEGGDCPDDRGITRGGASTLVLNSYDPSLNGGEPPLDTVWLVAGGGGGGGASGSGLGPRGPAVSTVQASACQMGAYSSAKGGGSDGTGSDCVPEGGDGSGPNGDGIGGLGGGSDRGGEPAIGWFNDTRNATNSITTGQGGPVPTGDGSNGTGGAGGGGFGGGGQGTGSSGRDAFGGGSGGSYAAQSTVNMAGSILTNSGTDGVVSFLIQVPTSSSATSE